MKQSAHASSITHLVEDIDIKALYSVQNCPVCAEIIGTFKRSRDTICKNCGYKESYCE